MPRVADDVCIDCLEKKDKLKRHRCENCYNKPPTEAKCLDCNRVVPSTEFGILYNNGRSYSTVCALCAINTNTVLEALCIGCNRMVSFNEFGVDGANGVIKDGSGRRGTICKKCECIRKCIQCNQKLKITEFMALGPQRVLKDGSGRIFGKRSMICNKCS